ncbi:class I SAM-dependent methyltransferase [Luedemannella flava]|uniref:Class I SAM-dependent methyltransferase n=1 Tax=Luedemannella flava TaxID=349316 RepID=A0ABN2LC95_9ACTN
MPEPSLWQELTTRDPGHAPAYIERFRTYERTGVDLGGEARLVDALAPRRARILDAGCGTGRVGARLHRLGHRVVGVDSDAQLLHAARADYPGPCWVQGDLAELDIVPEATDEPFDVVVAAGNVMAFLAPSSRRRVLGQLRRRLVADGRMIAGFDLDRGYLRSEFEEDARSSGLVVEHAFCTWDLRPTRADSTYVVYVLTPGVTAE